VADSVDVVGALIRRVNHACADAQRAVARSEMLVTARRLARDPSSMVRRCAWCGRMQLGHDWISADEAPAFLGSELDHRTSHGICERCIRKLEQDGASLPVKR
jgi:hypothetical protein